MQTQNLLILSSRQQRGTEVIDRAIRDFPAIVRALGFEPQRGNRAACIVCGTQNKTTFSFDPEAGTWHCFRCNRGGGVLDLAQAVHNCDRREAIAWVAQFVGVPLDRHTSSRAERRKYAQKRGRAENWAADLTEWCTRILTDLRARRNALWDTEHVASAWACNHLNHPSMANDLRWEVVWAHAFDNQRGDALNELIEQIEASSPMELAEMRRRWEAEV